MKNKKIFAALIILGAFSLPSICMAGALANVLRDWSPSGIYGNVAYVNRNMIMVKEHNVMLVDDVIGRTRYKTSVMDINGNELSATSIKAGVFVVVKGSGAYDPESKNNVIVAKEIYILPREMNENEISRYPILTEIASPW
jgi:hypothetical protein